MLNLRDDTRLVLVALACSLSVVSFMCLTVRPSFARYTLDAKA